MLAGGVDGSDVPKGEECGVAYAGADDSRGDGPVLDRVHGVFDW